MRLVMAFLATSAIAIFLVAIVFELLLPDASADGQRFASVVVLIAANMAMAVHILNDDHADLARRLERIESTLAEMELTLTEISETVVNDEG